MGKHTKGLWRVYKGHGSRKDKSGAKYVRVRGTVLGGKFHIADCPYESSLKIDQEEAEANARLIAAAPEMLEALVGIEKDAYEAMNDLAADIQEGGEINESWNAAHKKWSAVLLAIAKAKWEAQSE